MFKKVICILLCGLSLQGCWGKTELEEWGLVAAIAIDKNITDNNYEVTFQIIKPVPPETPVSENISTVYTVTASGKTIYEAALNILNNFDKLSYLGHNKVIVINENVAADGVSKIIDFFSRFEKVRRTNWVLVSKGISAKEIIENVRGLERIPAFRLEKKIKNIIYNSESAVPNILEFMTNVTDSEIEAIAGTIEVTKKSLTNKENIKSALISGIAVFKKDKLVGFLDNNESRGINWVLGKIKNAKVIIIEPESKDKYIALRVLKSKTKIKSEIINSGHHFNIDIKVECDIIEQQGDTDISKPENLEKLEKLAGETIKREMKKAIEKTKDEFNSDILGFGSSLRRSYPKEWKKIKDKWDTEFQKSSYSVNIKTTIRRSGEMIKSLQSNE